MGSGRGGLYQGTWGSREGEALRARVEDALSKVGGSLAAGAADEVAEALVRVAMGDSPEDAFPEPGEVAFDLALDALSPFVPGGGRVTRELAAAARRKGPSDAFLKAAGKGIVSDKSLEENAEFANERFRISDGASSATEAAGRTNGRLYLPILRLIRGSCSSGLAGVPRTIPLSRWMAARSAGFAIAHA